MSYPKDRFSARYMDRFVRNLVQLVRDLPRLEHQDASALPCRFESIRELRNV